MRKVIVLGIVVLSHVAVASCSSGNKSNNQVDQTQEQVAKVENLDVIAFKEQLSAEPGILVDVRTPGEVSEGKIPGALEINIMDGDFEERIAELDKSKAIYVYCKVGGRSAQAARKFIDLGFPKVYNLDGGMDAWKRKGYERE